MLKVYARNLGNVAVLCLQGRIVNGETRVLRDAVNSQANVTVIVLDLTRVTAIDARGLGTMLELRRQTISRGIRFKLMNVSKFTNRVLEITHLDSVFEIVPRGEQSISHKKQPRVEFAACA